MKAPEKLYLRKRNKLPLEVVRNKWYKTDPQSLYGSVEYSRTDAFVEKACEWLKDNITYIHPRKGTKECIVNLAKFKDYMKGE